MSSGSRQIISMCQSVDRFKICNPSHIALGNDVEKQYDTQNSECDMMILCSDGFMRCHSSIFYSESRRRFSSYGSHSTQKQFKFVLDYLYYGSISIPRQFNTLRVLHREFSLLRPTWEICKTLKTLIDTHSEQTGTNGLNDQSIRGSEVCESRKNCSLNQNSSQLISTHQIDSAAHSPPLDIIPIDSLHSEPTVSENSQINSKLKITPQREKLDFSHSTSQRAASSSSNLLQGSSASPGSLTDKIPRSEKLECSSSNQTVQPKARESSSSPGKKVLTQHSLAKELTSLSETRLKSESKSVGKLTGMSHSASSIHSTANTEGKKRVVARLSPTQRPPSKSVYVQCSKDGLDSPDPSSESQFSAIKVKPEMSNNSSAHSDCQKVPKMVVDSTIPASESTSRDGIRSGSPDKQPSTPAIAHEPALPSDPSYPPQTNNQQLGVDIPSSPLTGNLNQAGSSRADDDRSRTNEVPKSVPNAAPTDVDASSNSIHVNPPTLSHKTPDATCENSVTKFFCDKCGKQFILNVQLNKHKKKCLVESLDESNTKTGTIKEQSAAETGGSLVERSSKKNPPSAEAPHELPRVNSSDCPGPASKGVTFPSQESASTENSGDRSSLPRKPESLHESSFSSGSTRISPNFGAPDKAAILISGVPSKSSSSEKYREPSKSQGPDKSKELKRHSDSQLPREHKEHRKSTDSGFSSSSSAIITAHKTSYKSSSLSPLSVARSNSSNTVFEGSKTAGPPPIPRRVDIDGLSSGYGHHRKPSNKDERRRTKLIEIPEAHLQRKRPHSSNNGPSLSNKHHRRDSSDPNHPEKRYSRESQEAIRKQTIAQANPGPPNMTGK